MRIDNPYKILSAKTVYENPWIKVIEDKIVHPDGRDGVYATIKTNDSVTIIPVNEKGEIFMIRAYSYAGKKWHWELPAGGDDGEDYVSASKRELLEETGIEAKQWEQIGLARPMDGLMPERMAVLVAQDFTIGEIPPADDNGVIDQRRFFDLDTVRKMVMNGEIDEGQTLSALYYYELWLKIGK